MTDPSGQRPRRTAMGPGCWLAGLAVYPEAGGAAMRRQPAGRTTCEPSCKPVSSDPEVRIA